MKKQNQEISPEKLTFSHKALKKVSKKCKDGGFDFFPGKAYAAFGYVKKSKREGKF